MCEKTQDVLSCVEVFDIMRKLRIFSSDITLNTADGKPFSVLKAILVVGIESNIVTQFLHIVPSPIWLPNHICCP